MTTTRKHLTLSGVDIAAPGGIDALLAWHRATFGDARMEDPPSNDPPSNDPSAYTAPASQADLDRIIEDRLRRERAQTAEKYKDYDAVKDKAGKYDQQVAASATEQERAVAKAREEAEAAARADERAKAAPKLVMAEFRVAAAGRLDKGRLDTLTEDIDLTKYLREDGTVDDAKVAKKIDAWAPAEQQQSKGARRDPSQGARGGAATAGESGKAEAQRRYGKQHTQQ